MENRTVGSYVAQDFRTAAIFNKYGIDFCCKGGRTLDEVCDKKKIRKADVEDELDRLLSQKAENNIDFRQWPLDLLADYIEKTHHRYVEEKIPVLLQFLNKLCKVHGDRHPELFAINELFIGCAEELSQHLKKEELVLFPFIRKMVDATISGRELDTPHFGSVQNPVAMMMHEHDGEGERFRKIAALTNNYTPPADACNTYKVTYAMLKEFEEDLHKHIHLENNILFPSAVVLEQKFE
ncbi:iron-sulfur cluster repair di-iron protein [Myroides injenensis]|uniref:iron-sulfur cluster repair di-iron protein n=1 Tax=Myroides injenensis TaxID=1183151 RepID=UPI00031AB671|nr:iron-sulfur cluster repair di-iron protein [Myroides injenensis]